MSDDNGATDSAPRAIAPRMPVPRPPGPDSAPKEISTEHFSLPEVDSDVLSEVPDFERITEGLPQNAESRVKHGPDGPHGAEDGLTGIGALTGKLRGWGSSAAGAIKKAVAAPATEVEPESTEQRAEPEEDAAVPEALWTAGDAPAASPAPVKEATPPVFTATAPASERPAPAPAGVGPRKVKLSVARIDPWSVMKLSFLLSVAIGIMIVVAAWVFWYALNDLAVFTSINDLIQGIAPESDLDILEFVARDRVLSLATVIAVVDVVLLTALATILAFLYNIVASLVGGIHLTMTDD